MKKVVFISIVLLLGVAVAALETRALGAEYPVCFSEKSFLKKPFPLKHSEHNLKVWRGKFRSCRIPEGWQIALYNGSNYGPNALMFNGPVEVPDLSIYPVLDTNVSWEGQVASVIVFRDGFEEKDPREKKP